MGLLSGLGGAIGGAFQGIGNSIGGAFQGGGLIGGQAAPMLFQPPRAQIQPGTGPLRQPGLFSPQQGAPMTSQQGRPMMSSQGMPQNAAEAYRPMPVNFTMPHRPQQSQMDIPDRGAYPGGAPKSGISAPVMGSIKNFLGDSFVKPAYAANPDKVRNDRIEIPGSKFGENYAGGGMNMTAEDFNPGDLAARYEVEQVRNRPIEDQVGFISTGMGGKDPGGVSYGPYQIETKKGTMSGYLKYGDKYSEQLKGYKMNSPEFKAKWKELAAKDPIGFKNSQFNYLASKPGGYNDALKYAKAHGWNTDSPVMQGAIYSISNQSGGWRRGIFDKAGISPEDSLDTQINKLYDARGAYFDKGLRNGWYGRDVYNGITNKRVKMEREDALNMIHKGSWKY